MATRHGKYICELKANKFVAMKHLLLSHQLHRIPVTEVTKLTRNAGNACHVLHLGQECLPRQGRTKLEAPRFVGTLARVVLRLRVWEGAGGRCSSASRLFASAREAGTRVSCQEKTQCLRVRVFRAIFDHALQARLRKIRVHGCARRSKIPLEIGCETISPASIPRLSPISA